MNGCSTPAAVRAGVADDLATQKGWSKVIINTSSFSLLSYLSPHKKGPELTIYIAGDGLAWVSRSKPSANPTPGNPIALKLALQDDNRPVAYLARPCQYIRLSLSRECNSSLWTNARFSAKVIASINEAISQLKKRTNSSRINIVGFSGGGAIAALIAARRKDVKLLVTVAGNLDHLTWTQTHNVSPLIGSLNPVDYWKNLIDVTQVHFVGSRDRVMPPKIAEAYKKQFVGTYRPEIRVVRGADHHCCWVKQWKAILTTLK